MNRLIVFFVFFLSLLLNGSPADTAFAENNDFYKLEMQRLIKEIRVAARERNPRVGVLGNGGSNLYNPFAYSEKSSEYAENALALVDGILIESLNFGYDYEDDKRTPDEARGYFLSALKLAKERGAVLFNIDYCSEMRNKSLGKTLSRQDGFINFSAKRNLDELPLVKLNEKAVTNLGDCENFCVLLNPHKFFSKDVYLERLRKSNYDLLIIDGYYGDNFLEYDDVASLKQKPNGEPRLVYCYMSVGEAEEYRWYWDKSYENTGPEWLAEKNEHWAGNYKVKYWLEPWHAILYKGDNSYLSKILNAGFDGVFLDVIDAFAYFETKAFSYNIHNAYAISSYF